MFSCRCYIKFINCTGCNFTNLSVLWLLSHGLAGLDTCHGKYNFEDGAHDNQDMYSYHGFFLFLELDFCVFINEPSKFLVTTSLCFPVFDDQYAIECHRIDNDG